MILIRPLIYPTPVFFLELWDEVVEESCISDQACMILTGVC